MATENTLPESADELLQEGIDAAKSGQRRRAHDLLMQVLQQDERNVNAWLWLSGVAESLAERETYLENVLVLDPGNEAARRGLEMLRSHMPERLLDDGIAAAQAGQTEQARGLLTQVIEQDERSAAAWLWLSRIVQDPEELEICLENMLTLEPDNEEAQQRLASLQAQKEKQASTAAEETAHPLGLDLPPELAEKFKDKYQCPFCAARSEPDAQFCAACGEALWVKAEQEPDRSPSRSRSLVLQIASSMLHAVGLILLLAYVELQVGLQDPLSLAGLYLGFPGDLAPEVTRIALGTVPRTAVLVIIFLFLASLIVLIGMFLRLRPKATAYMLLVNAAGMIVTAVFVTSLLWPAEGWGGQTATIIVRAGLALMDASLLFVAVGLVYGIRHDIFTPKEMERLLLQLDRGLVEPGDFMDRGRQYIERKMWARAALHLHRATSDSPSFDLEQERHLALTKVYIHLKWFDLAERSLDEAIQTNPHNPRISEMNALLLKSRPETGE